MKTFFMKLVSSLLVVSICISIPAELFSAFTVSAVEIEINDRTEEESIEDKSSRFPAGNWTEAENKSVVPPYAHFHIDVQNYILDKNIFLFQKGIFTKEKPITFQKDHIPPGNKTDQGKVDLYYENNGTAFFWEVKPGSYLQPSKMMEGIDQLSRYALYSKVNDANVENRIGNIPYSDENKAYLRGDISLIKLFECFLNIPQFKEEYGNDFDLDVLKDIDITFDLTIDSKGKYQILIAYLPGGLILYWFCSIDSKSDKPQPELSAFWWLVGRSFVKLWKDVLNNPDDYPTSDQQPDPSSDIPLPNQPIVPQPGEKEEPSYPIKEKPSMSTYVWKDGAIVSRATGKIIYQSKNIEAMLAYAVALKAMCDAQASGGLFTQKGTVSNWAQISAVCSIVIKGLSLPVGAESEDDMSADEAVSGINLFRSILNLFPGEISYFNEKSETEGGKCHCGWWDSDCCSEECTCELSNPNESTCKEIEEEVEKAGSAAAPRDPLVIDLGDEGILLTSVENGVYFDLDNNGFAEKTAWVGAEDGFLVLDRNGNGRIDNGGELFGDQVILKTGSKSESGFEALSELDENDDGVIDANDTLFSDLMVWIDKNQNGISETSELTTLDALNITLISLSYQQIGNIDGKTGTVISLESNVLFENNATRKISEHWFKVNSRDSQDLHDYGDGVIVTSVESFGNIMSLNNAIFSDKTGELSKLVNEFKSSVDYVEKRVIIKRILYFITGATNITPNSRGGNIDARDLHVIEQFMGQGFIGIDGGTSPNANAASILSKAYLKIENMYFNQLNRETAFDYYIGFVLEDKIFDDEGTIIDQALDLSVFPYIIPENGNKYYYSHVVSCIASWLLQYDNAFGTTSFSDFKAYFPEYSAFFNVVENGNVLLSGNKGEIIYGTSGIDLIWCMNGNNTLMSGYGDDVLYGGGDNDILDGGAGNDTLLGGAGNDTYIFSRGYGNDIVIDDVGINKIVLNGINLNDISVNGTGIYDITISIKHTGDSLTISNFRKDNNRNCFEFVINGLLHDINDSHSPFRHICGDNGNNVIQTIVDNSIIHAFGGNDNIYCSPGDDIVYCGEGNDYVYADKGDDIVYGGEGDDVLNGGEGNDFLYGGFGNDTYIFGRNCNTDVISDNEGVSLIWIAENISLDDLDIISIGEDIVIDIKDSEDKLIINGFAENLDNYVLKVGGESVSLRDSITTDESEFLSGSKESDYFVNESSIIVAGGSGDDRIIGNDGDELIFGDSGNDQILSGDGNDIIFGGSGDDYINSGNGNDMIDGGSGNDFIDGGAGNDTYFFNPDYGNDSIKDSEGTNTTMFGDGFTASGIKAYRSNWNDLLITFDGFEDTLTIKNYCINKNARNFTLVFADGTVVEAAAKDSPLRKIYGTDGSEYMESIYDDGIINDAQESDDQIVGSDGNDMLYGGDGDERITGKSGDDILDGGKGNDYLSGGAGNDTYIFNKGYGVDTISDGEGTNTINVYGYSASQIKAYRTNWNDITITFVDSEDKIIIEGFFTSEANRNFYLTFNGSGGIHATASNSPLRTIYGTDGDEYIAAMDDRGVTLYGKGGADNLNGGSGADKLYGGTGNDQLYGNGGNDTLDGGEGDDMLYGGAGNDTYIFNVGSGTDIIVDSEGVNTISLGAGLTEDDMIAYRHNWNDLIITFGGVEDKLIIQGYFGSENNRNFEIRFANGTRYAYDNTDNPIKQVHATEYDDWMTAWSDNGITLYGDGGNDNLTGGMGDDMLFGGAGNDTLNGNDGDDILDGGEGDDFLYGGLGNDTYRFGIGYGSDLIEDSEGDNKVELLGINFDTVSFELTGSGELIITVIESGEVLTIRNFDTECFIFEFADGVIGTFNTKTGAFAEMVPEEEIA